MQNSIIYRPEQGLFSAPYTQQLADLGAELIDPTQLPVYSKIDVALGTSTVLPSMDFETYSEAGFTIDPVTGKVRGVTTQGKGGLPAVGTPVYAEHPSTEILCLYYDLKDGRGRRGWLPGTPNPTDLLEHIAGGGLIEAWNVTFEFWIWNMVCVRRLGWPVLTQNQCRCVMAQSRLAVYAATRRPRRRADRPHTATGLQQNRRSPRHLYRAALDGLRDIQRGGLHH